MKIKNYDKVKSNFNAILKNTFSKYDYTELKDEIGFTLRDKYPARVTRRLKIRDGSEYVPFFNFYLRQDFKADKVLEGAIPLVVGVELTLKTKEFYGQEYHYVLDDSSLGSKIHRPINISTSDEFCFLPTTKTFYRKRKSGWQEISLDAIKTLVFKLHLSEYSTTTGIKSRAKILILRTLPSKSCSSLAKVLGGIYGIIKGTYFAYDPILRSLTDETSRGEHKPPPKTESDDMNFFGYKVKTWTLCSYSVLLISLTLLFRVRSLALIKFIETSTILTLTTAIVSIVTYDRLIPFLLKNAIVYLSTKSLILNVKSVSLKF